MKKIEQQSNMGFRSALQRVDRFEVYSDADHSTELKPTDSNCLRDASRKLRRFSAHSLATKHVQAAAAILASQGANEQRVAWLLEDCLGLL